MILPDIDYSITPLIETQSTSWGGGFSAQFDVLQRMVAEIRIGETVYKPRSPFIATFSPFVSGVLGECNVERCPVPIIGKGKDFHTAQQDWAEQFHYKFQTLFVKRPWEMTEQEKREWQLIEQWIDVGAYQRDTPYVIRQIGVVIQCRPHPSKIRWENGTTEKVTLKRMPAEFVRYAAGQRFEAEVRRDAMSHKLLRVLVVRRLPQLKPIAEDSNFWEQFPTTKDVESLEWSEFE